MHSTAATDSPIVGEWSHSPIAPPMTNVDPISTRSTPARVSRGLFRPGSKAARASLLVSHSRAHPPFEPRPARVGLDLDVADLLVGQMAEAALALDVGLDRITCGIQRHAPVLAVLDL